MAQGIINRENEQALSQARLKELLHYCPDTGIFTWREDRGGAAKRGTVSGGLSPYGYVLIRVDGLKYFAHRLAWLYMDGYFPECRVDHISRVRHENVWDNLREASPSCNTKNSKTPSTNKSGVVGVSKLMRNGKWTGKWRAQINDRRGKKTYLGIFSDPVMAILARFEAELMYGYSECLESTARAYLLKNQPCLLEFDFAIKKRWADNGGKFVPSIMAQTIINNTKQQLLRRELNDRFQRNASQGIR